MEQKTPLQFFAEHEKKRPDSFFLIQPVDGEKIGFTWRQAGEEVRKMAAVIRDMNLPPKSSIGLLSKNCAWWILADLAILMSGHISVPIYPNAKADTLNYILKHSDCKLLFAGKLDNWDSIKEGVPKAMQIISFTKYPIEEGTNWDQIIQNKEPLIDFNDPDHEDIATIIYTSGTTGKPKGVVHSYGNLTYAMNAFAKELPVGGMHTRAMSYLPLAHIAERVLLEMGTLERGSTIYFADSLETFAEDLKFACPTSFGGVPRIWTKLKLGVEKKIPPGKLNKLLKIPILKSIVKARIKEGLGLHESSTFFTGAAPTPPSLIDWYKKIDIELQEVYGMTENAAYSHCNRQGRVKVGSAGEAMPDVEVRISPEGEILMKCPCLMLCYYKDPEQTAAVMQDGFFRTGDAGFVDEAGYLFITGRVKEIFKTEKGKYVSPSGIESKLSTNPAIDQVCVMGMHLPQPIAVVQLSEEAQKEETSSIEASLMESLQDLNPQLEKHERIKKIVIGRTPWTIENEMLTPTLKLKRSEIEKSYQKKYRSWYETEKEIIWEEKA